MVKDETPIYTYSEEIETEGQLGNWKGCLPYSAKRDYNPDDLPCEKFLNVWMII